MCRLAVDEPIGGRLGVIINALCPIHVNERWGRNEIRFEESLLAPGVLHDKPQSSHFSDSQHLDRKRKEVLPIFRPLQYKVGFLLHALSSVVDTRPKECHLTCRAKVDAREESHDEIVLRDVVPQTRLSIVCVLNRPEEVIVVVSLSEVILNVVVFGRYAQFDELSFKRARLLKEAMHLSFNLHDTLRPKKLKAKRDK